MSAAPPCRTHHGGGARVLAAARVRSHAAPRAPWALRWRVAADSLLRRRPGHPLSLPRIDGWGAETPKDGHGCDGSKCRFCLLDAPRRSAAAVRPLRSWQAHAASISRLLGPESCSQSAHPCHGGGTCNARGRHVERFTVDMVSRRGRHPNRRGPHMRNVCGGPRCQAH